MTIDMATLPTLIITRPLAQAQRLAEALKQQGLNSFNFPLLEICPIDSSILREAFTHIQQFALAIFVSPTAIEIALGIYQKMTVAPWSIPIAVPGPGSVAALSAQGITTTSARIISPIDLLKETASTYSFDSEGLLRALEQAKLGLTQLRGQRVLLVRGVGGRELLAQTLNEAGVDLTIAEVYQRQLPIPDDALWDKLKQVVAVPHCWLLTSSEAVHNFQIMRQAMPWLKQLGPVVVTHARIAQKAQQLGFSKIMLIDEVRPQELIRSLSSIQID